MDSTTSNKRDKLALQKIRLTNPIHFLAVGFGSGLIYPAPGTWGTVAGLLVGIILLHWISVPVFFFLTIIAFILGIYLCTKTSETMQVHDHSSIVWDEIVAMWLILCVLPTHSWLWYIIGFVLFRFFDIVKPAPIRYFDRKLTSGFGIMIDDIIAALYVILIIIIYQWLS